MPSSQNHRLSTADSVSTISVPTSSLTASSVPAGFTPAGFTLSRSASAAPRLTLYEIGRRVAQAEIERQYPRVTRMSDATRSGVLNHGSARGNPSTRPIAQAQAITRNNKRTLPSAIPSTGSSSSSVARFPVHRPRPRYCICYLAPMPSALVQAGAPPAVLRRCRSCRVQLLAGSR